MRNAECACLAEPVINLSVLESLRMYPAKLPLSSAIDEIQRWSAPVLVDVQYDALGIDEFGLSKVD